MYALSLKVLIKYIAANSKQFLVGVLFETDCVHKPSVFRNIVRLSRGFVEHLH